MRIVSLANTTDLGADHAAAAVLRALEQNPGQDLDELLPLAAERARHPATTAAADHRGDNGARPRRELGRFTCDQVPGTLRLTRTGDTFHLWRRGTPDPLAPTGAATWAGDGYTLTLPGGTDHIEGFTLDLDRAPGLAYVRLPSS
ncbi:hypothetical protein ACFVUW_10260 [Streptomyces xiamenensis]|uniref:hypothetical protein n=1 Tax=Streptomyces xiamenensis TaxID=408015 RepID=UPI0036E23DA6